MAYTDWPPNLTSLGGYTCPSCGSWVANGVTHACATNYAQFGNPPRQGWECPRCGKIHAPWVASCDCHLGKFHNLKWLKQFEPEETKTISIGYADSGTTPRHIVPDLNYGWRIE